MLIILIRTILLYLLVIFALRLMGKKQLGELQPSELVTTILISNIATLSLEDPNLPMLAGVIPILLIISIDVIMSVVTLKSESVRRLVAGSPRIIISNGVLNQKEIATLRYTIDDIFEAMRDNGIFDISKVQFAVVETTGKINFYEMPEPPEPNEDPPFLIVKDGVLNESGLTEAGKDEKWLRGVLFDNNITIPRIFILTVTNSGECFIVKKEK